MKNFAVVLALFLMTVNASGQPSRREVNNQATVGKVKPRENSANNRPTVNENRRPVNNNVIANRHYPNEYPSFDRRFNGGREVEYHYPAPPKPREYRRIYAPYRVPAGFSFYWTPEIRFEYIRLYPAISYRKYPVGYRIENVSAYDALHLRGEIANVYGKVYEVYYSRYTDEYIFYFGAFFPYHDFTAVIPGEIARKYSPWPEMYFNNEHLIITGLITSNEGKPEIAVRTKEQINQY
jgi:hypothetical protein